jgi:hypothetical protein
MMCNKMLQYNIKKQLLSSTNNTPKTITHVRHKNQNGPHSHIMILIQEQSSQNYSRTLT